MLWLLIDRTLFGARLRAAVDNPRIARAVGIDVNRLFTVTFVGGCALAGFGGVIGAEMLPLEPFYALRYLVLFLVVVAVGGLGSFKGSFVAAVTLGMIDTAGKFLFPEISRLPAVRARLPAAAVAAERAAAAEGCCMTTPNPGTFALGARRSRSVWHLAAVGDRDRRLLTSPAVISASAPPPW